MSPGAIPSARPTTSAVARWSPVSMTTRTPPARSAASAAGVVARTGIDDADQAGEPAVQDDEDERLAARAALARRRGDRRDIDAELGHETRVAEAGVASGRRARRRLGP